MNNDDFLGTLQESCEVFSKYQMKIHHDSPSECDFDQVGYMHLTLSTSEHFTHTSILHRENFVERKCPLSPKKLYQYISHLF